MRTLQHYRDEHGEFIYPTDDEIAVASTAISLAVQSVFSDDLRPLTGRFVRAARLDLASRALTLGDGYKRTVTTFKDLTRAELNFVVDWINTVHVADEMQRAGWRASGPTPARAKRLADQTLDMPPRTLKALRERYMPQTVAA